MASFIGYRWVFTLRHRRHAGGRSTKDRSLARFVCPPAFVRFTIVIFVSRDCMKTTYCKVVWQTGSKFVV